MRAGIREKQEDPSREDEVVLSARKGSMKQIRFPDLSISQPIAAADRSQSPGKYLRAFDCVDRAADSAPEGKVERALTGPDFEHARSSPDAGPIEQRLGDRIPEFCLCPEPRRFDRRVAQQVPISARLSAFRRNHPMRVRQARPVRYPGLAAQ
jgi:hypothetical protein